MLARTLPHVGAVLEVGSGTGELAVALAARFPGLAWQPSDPDPAARASIAAWTAQARTPNVLPPLDLDLLAPTWRLRRADAVLCVNVLHAAPPAAVEALAAGARAVLPPGGALVVAGPFRRPGEALAAPFAHLGGRVPELEELVERGQENDLAVVETAPLPQDCLCVVMRRR